MISDFTENFIPFLVLTTFEVSTPEAVCPDFRTPLPADLKNVIFQKPGNSKNAILIQEIQQIVKELTVGIFVYNAMPLVEFVPSKTDTQTSKVVVNMPYKNTLTSLLLFKYLYKTNLLYAGCKVKNKQTADLTTKEEAFSYPKSGYEAFIKQVKQNETSKITLENSTLADILRSTCNFHETKPGTLEYKENVRLFQMQVNPKVHEKSQEMLALIQKHSFKIDYANQLVLASDHDDNTYFMQNMNKCDKHKLTTFCPLPESKIRPVYNDRFEKILGFHKEMVEKELDEILTDREKYLQG